MSIIRQSQKELTNKTYTSSNFLALNFPFSFKWLLSIPNFLFPCLKCPAFSAIFFSFLSLSTLSAWRTNQITRFTFGNLGISSSFGATIIVIYEYREIKIKSGQECHGLRIKYLGCAIISLDRKSTRLNSSHALTSRMPSSA